MTSLVETYRGAVYPWHCDHMGHMNATRNFFTLLGLAPRFLREHRRGMAAVHLDLAHRRASPLPEEMRTRARDMTVEFALPWAANATGDRNVE